jgi:urea carboxylase-associated protein 2
MIARTSSYEALIEGGKHWSFTIRAGLQLRLTDVEGGANVGMLFYNPQNALERYNAPDTLKCQHTFKLTRGHCLYSDMGRIFCSITHDSVGWHDTACGSSSPQAVEQRWGRRRYQEYRNEWQQNGLDAFLVEAGKYGLGRRDLAANVNWFSKAVADDDGSLSFEASNSCAGQSVELRFEMDTLVLLHTCPHPLNSALEYPRRPVRLHISQAQAVTAEDFCRNSRPENARGFANTEFHRLCAGQAGEGA